MRKHVIVRLALALALIGAMAGCGDDDGGDAVGGSAGSDSEEAALAPGVTEDSIKIGVTYVDLEAVRDIIDLDHGDYEAIYSSLIKDVNEGGGIGGRTLEPVFAAVNPLGTESADAVCKQMVEEEKVFVTIGFFQADRVLCHVEKGNSAVLGGTMTPQLLEKAKAPWFTIEPSVDLEIEAIREFEEADLFQEKFAVFGVNTDEALITDAIQPALEEFGVTPVDVGILEVDTADPAAAVTGTLAMIDRFRAAGATQVLVAGQAAVTWADALQQTDYRPATLFPNGVVIGSYLNDTAGKDLSILEGAVSADIYGGRVNQYSEANMQLCVGALKARGIDIPEPTNSPVPSGTPDPFTGALIACKTMTLLKGLLTNVEGDLNYETFRNAANVMGDLPMPASDRPYRYGDPPQADGDAPVSLFRFDPPSKVFVRIDT